MPQNPLEIAFVKNEKLSRRESNFRAALEAVRLARLPQGSRETARSVEQVEHEIELARARALGSAARLLSRGERKLTIRDVRLLQDFFSRPDTPHRVPAKDFHLHLELLHDERRIRLDPKALQMVANRGTELEDQAYRASRKLEEE